MNVDTDIVVIGAGPTGLTLANLLGQRGIRVVLLEARTELIDYPRAVGIDDESMRAMQTIGLVDEVLPHTVPDQAVRIVNGAGKVIAEIDPRTREFGWPRRNGFVQPLVDQVLLDGLKRFDTVDVRFGVEAVGLRQGADSATVVVRAADGTTTDVVGRYVVGCEGGRSFTRQQLGIAFDGETRQQRGLVIDVERDPLGTPHAVFGGDPKRGYATLSLPHGIRRWEFMLLDDETDEVATSDAFVHRLLAAHVPDPRSLQIIRRRVYAHHARIAERFREGRVLLAGDAAHVMPVVAGQGWNSCIRDAMNLGWKLAAVVEGRSTDALLDTYARERRDHVKAMVELSVSMSNLVANRSPLRSGLRDATAAVVDRLPRLREWVSGQGFKPMPKYEDGVVVATPLPRFKSVPVVDDGHRSTGMLFPQPRVRTADARDVLLDDATGSDWRVFMWNNDPVLFLSEATRRRLDGLEARLVQVVPSEQLPWAVQHASPGVLVVGDTSGALKAWFHRRPFSAIVVRPDHVVAAECLAQELDAVVDKVIATTRPTAALR